MGLFAPVAAYLSARLGTRRAMTIGLVLIGVFGMLRGARPEHVARRRCSPGASGIGMGIGNALGASRRPGDGARAARDGDGRLHDGHPDRLDRRRGDRGPARRRPRRLARRPDRAVRRRLRRSPWRGPCWSEVARRTSAARAGSSRACRGGRARPGCSSRSSPRWASAYYGLIAWLPDAYGERGWSDSSAGLLIAAMNLTAIPCSFVVPWLSDRHGGRRPWLVGVTLLLRRRRDRSRRASRRGVCSGRSSPASRRAARSRS